MVDEPARCRHSALWQTKGSPHPSFKRVARLHLYPTHSLSAAFGRSLEAATPPGHPDYQASGILSDGALGRRCYLLIPGDLNNALQLCFQTPSRPRRTAIIFRQLGSADYDLGRRPAPSREESVSLLAIPEWRLHPHIFQEAPMAHAITILQVDNTITLVATTYLIYVYPQYVSMRAAIVAI